MIYRKNQLPPTKHLSLKRARLNEEHFLQFFHDVNKAKTKNSFLRNYLAKIYTDIITLLRDLISLFFGNTTEISTKEVYMCYLFNVPDTRVVCLRKTIANFKEKVEFSEYHNTHIPPTIHEV